MMKKITFENLYSACSLYVSRVVRWKVLNSYHQRNDGWLYGVQISSGVRYLYSACDTCLQSQLLCCVIEPELLARLQTKISPLSLFCVNLEIF